MFLPVYLTPVVRIRRPSSSFVNHLLILLLGLCLYQFDTISACAGINDTGDISPDQNVQNGTSFKINCTLNGNTLSLNNQTYAIDSSMLFMKHGNREIPMDLIRLVDKHTISYEVNKATLDDSGSYLCHLRINSQTAFICMSTVTVGYPPKNISKENFSCQSYELEKMICSWNPEPNFVKTTYKLYEAADPIFDLIKGWYQCPEQVNEHACQWTIDSEPVYRIGSENFLFRLISNNSFGTTNSYFNISHYEIMEPGIPRQFNYTKLNASSVHFEWNAPMHFDYNINFRKRLSFQLTIDYHPVQVNALVPVKRLLFNLGNKYAFTFNQLIPFSKYRFSLRSHVSNGRESPLWGKAANLTLQTPPDIPYHCPAFFNSSFESSTTVTGDRSITVYWKPIDLYHANAPNLQYKVDYGRIESLQVPRLIDNMSHVFISNSSVTFHTFEQMHTNASYVFYIRSLNEMGTSRCRSQLLIDKLINQPLKPMDLTVSYLGDGRYELKWKHSRPNQVKQFNVYWCPNVLPRPFPCVGVLNSKSVINSDFSENTNHNFSHVLEHLDDKLNYQFSIAAEGELSSSGISWASCIIPKQIEKLEKINDFRAVAISPYTVEVNWKLHCSAMSELIEKYEISSCDVQENDMNKCESNQRVIVDGGESERTELKNLQPNTWYRVSIRALNSNKASEENFAIVRTFDGPPAQPRYLIHQKSSSRSIVLHWTLAVGPKESINFFEITYSDTLSSFDSKKVCTQTAAKSVPGSTRAVKTSYECSVKIDKNVRPNTLYQMQLKGCITNNFMGILRPVCSSPTNITVKTDVDAPGVTRKPYIKIVDKSHVLLEWPEPEHPNGIIDHYKVRLYYQKSVHNEWSVKGNKTQIEINCSQYSAESSEDDINKQINYPFVSVAAVNIKNQTLLVGPFSEHSSANLCESITPEMRFSDFIGFTISGGIGILILMILSIFVFKGLLKKFNQLKKLAVDLPSGLQDIKLNLNNEMCKIDVDMLTSGHIIQRKPSNMFLNNFTINTDHADDRSAQDRKPYPAGTRNTDCQLLLSENAETQNKLSDETNVNKGLDNNLENAEDNLRKSSSASSCLDAVQSDQSNADEQKPLLASARPNGIDSSGSNDSGVDVQVTNANFKNKNDLVLLQPLSSSVPLLSANNVAEADPVAPNLIPEFEFQPTEGPECDFKLSDIDISALCMSNDLIDFQQFAQDHNSKEDGNEDSEEASVGSQTMPIQSLSLLDLRNLKIDVPTYDLGLSVSPDVGPNTLMTTIGCLDPNDCKDQPINITDSQLMDGHLNTKASSGDYVPLGPKIDIDKKSDCGSSNRLNLDYMDSEHEIGTSITLDLNDFAEKCVDPLNVSSEEYTLKVDDFLFDQNLITSGALFDTTLCSQLDSIDFKLSNESLHFLSGNQQQKKTSLSSNDQSKDNYISINDTTKFLPSENQ